MVPHKLVITANISLAFISVVLLLTLFGVEIPSAGKALYTLDTDEPTCTVRSYDRETQWDNLDRCCLEARKQLDCIQKGKGWICSSGGSVEYQLNRKAYAYCTQQEIWR